MGVSPPGQIDPVFLASGLPTLEGGNATFSTIHMSGGGEVIREQIKNDLIEQLNTRGMTQSFYTSLIDDYLALWDMKNALIEDINDRGVSIEWNNGGGQKGRKKNDSIAELNKTNGQMLKILSELGLRGADVKAVDVDEVL